MAASLRATVVGINTYADPRYRKQSQLGFARADAEKIAEGLYGSRAFGVAHTHLHLLTDARASAAGIRRALEDAFPEQPYGENTISLFYFAGHGLTNERDERIYLCAHDVDFTDPNQGGIRLNDIYDLLLRSGASASIAILDACYSGGITDNKRLDYVTAAERAKQAIQSLRTPDGKTVAIFAACRTDQTSRENAMRGHGIYTAELLDGWCGGEGRDDDGVVRLLGLANYLTRRFEFDKQVPPYVIRGARPLPLWIGEPRSPDAPRPPIEPLPPRNALTQVDVADNVIPTYTSRPRSPVQPVMIAVALMVLVLGGLLSLATHIVLIFLIALAAAIVMAGAAMLTRSGSLTK